MQGSAIFEIEFNGNIPTVKNVVLTEDTIKNISSQVVTPATNIVPATASSPVPAPAPTAAPAPAPAPALDTAVTANDTAVTAPALDIATNTAAPATNNSLNNIIQFITDFNNNLKEKGNTTVLLLDKDDNMIDINETFLNKLNTITIENIKYNEIYEDEFVKYIKTLLKILNQIDSSSDIYQHIINIFIKIQEFITKNKIDSESTVKLMENYLKNMKNIKSKKGKGGKKYRTKRRRGSKKSNYTNRKKRI